MVALSFLAMSRASASVLFFSMRDSCSGDSCSGDSSPLAEMLQLVELLALLPGVREVSAILLLGGKLFSSPSSTMHALVHGIHQCVFRIQSRIPLS